MTIQLNQLTAEQQRMFNVLINLMKSKCQKNRNQEFMDMITNPTKEYMPIFHAVDSHGKQLIE